MFERYCLKRLTFSPNVFLEAILQRMPETVHVRKDSKIISSVFWERSCKGYTWKRWCLKLVFPPVLFFGKDPVKDTPGKGGVRKLWIPETGNV